MSSTPFTVYNTTTREILRITVCVPGDIGLKEGEAAIEGWFDDIEHVVAIDAKGNAVAARKPQEEIDTFHADQKSHLEMAEALNVDTADILAEALRQKGFDLSDEDLATAKTNLQAQARIQVQEDQAQPIALAKKK